MKHEKTTALFEYWTALRGNRKAPMRLELDPSAIAPLLGNAFVLERLDPVTFNFRLAGTRICSFHDKELRGRSFLDLWGGNDRETLERVLQAATNNAAGAVIGYDAYARDDLKVSFEMILLPLARENGAYDRIIGVAAPLGNDYWIGIMPITHLEVRSIRYLWPNDRPIPADGVENDPAFPVMAETTTPVSANDDGQKPIFEVIEGGRH